MKQAFMFVGAAVTIALVMALSWAWSGYVLTILWGWFIVPTFSAPELSIPAAMGVAMVVGYLTKTHQRQGSEFPEALVAAFLVPAIALLMGWVVQHWM